MADVSYRLYRLLVACIGLVVAVGTITIGVPLLASSSTTVYDANEVKVEVVTSGNYSLTVTTNNVLVPVTGAGGGTYSFSHSNNFSSYWQILIDYSEGSSHPVTIKVSDENGNTLVVHSQDSGRMVFWVNLKAR